MSKNIITGIDIGTTKIAIIIAEVQDNDSINILGFGESESRGLRQGIVENIEETSKSIKKALEMAQTEADIETNSAYVGLTGAHVRGVNGVGVITISDNEYMAFRSGNWKKMTGILNVSVRAKFRLIFD